MERDRAIQQTLASEELEKSEQRYRDVFENSTDLLYLLEVTEDGRFRNLAVNPAFEASTGLSRDQLIGKTIEETVPEETARLTNAKYRHAVEAGAPIDEEIELDLPTGHRTYHSTLVPKRDSTGRVSRIVGISRDVTEYRRALRDLEEARERMSQVLESVSDGFFVLDRSGRYTYLNTNAGRMAGRDSADLLGKVIWEEFPEAVDSPLWRIFHEVMSTRRGMTYSQYFAPLETWYEGTVYPHPDGVCVFARDVTDRKRAEEAIREKDLGIRRAYVEVIAAVTGDKLVLLTPEEIESALGRPVSDRLAIADASQMAGVRHAVVAVLRDSAPAVADPELFITAVGEALTNALRYAGRGACQVFVRNGTAQIEVSDTGPGIDFATLPRATLLSGYSTKQTLGMGFTIMLELCDQVLVSTGPEGTRLVLESCGG